MAGRGGEHEACVQMHDARAESYAAEMKDEMQKPMYTERLPCFVEGCPSSGALVDVGCGSGDCLALVHKLYPSVPLVGTEISANMAEIARKQVPSATITLGGACLQLQENSLRGILSYFVIHFLTNEQLAAAAASWCSALQPGGHLLLGFWVGEPDTAMEMGDQWSQVYATYNSVVDVEMLLRSSGFDIVSSEQEEDLSMGMLMGFIEASKK